MVEIEVKIRIIDIKNLGEKILQLGAKLEKERYYEDFAK